MTDRVLRCKGQPRDIVVFVASGAYAAPSSNEGVVSLRMKIIGADSKAAGHCWEPIRSVEAASADRDTQYILAKFQWGTCMTEKYQSEIGAYPTKPWKSFLRNYHIREKVKLPEDNSEDD